MNAPVLRSRLLTLFHESWKYFLVSLASLAVDQAVFWLLVHPAHVYYPFANVVSVLTGLTVNYVLSIRLVFHERRLTSRGAEFVGFVAIGVAGLAVNEGFLIALVSGVGLPPVIGKIAAAGPSFLFNFAVRRALLFTERR